VKIIINNIPESVNIIQSKIDAGQLSVFCGAGISMKSGIPTVIPLVRKFLEQLGFEEEDIKTFLKNNELPIPFEAIVQDFKENFLFEGGRSFLPEFVRLFEAKPNANHYLLARLFESKKIDKIITTNFDNCIEKSFSDKKNNKKKLVVYSETISHLKSAETAGKVVKIHGSAERRSTLGATVDQITKTEFYNKNLIVLDNVLDTSRAILFLGYSCSDKWDVTKIFTEYVSRKGRKPEIIFWQHYDSANSHPSENQKKIFKSYKCSWLCGDTDKLVSQLAVTNGLDIPDPPYRKAVYTFEGLKPNDPNYVLGRLLQTANFHRLAVKFLERFVALAPESTAESIRHAKAFESLADVYRKFNEFRKSRRSFLKAIELMNSVELVDKKEVAFSLARLYSKLSMLLLDNKKSNAGAKYMDKAIGKIRPYRRGRLSIDHKFQMAETFNDFAYLKFTEKEYASAASIWFYSLKLREQLSKVYPQRYLIYFSESLNNIGSSYYFMDKYFEAIDYTTRAVNVVRELSEINPVIYLPLLSLRLNNLGAMYRENANRKMALITLKEALSIRQKLATDDPDVYLPKVAFTMINLSVVYLKLPKNKTASLKYLSQAIGIIKKFKRKTAVEKYLENIAKVLKAWSIEPTKYLKENWGLEYQSRQTQ